MELNEVRAAPREGRWRRPPRRGENTSPSHVSLRLPVARCLLRGRRGLQDLQDLAHLGVELAHMTAHDPLGFVRVAILDGLDQVQVFFDGAG